MGRPNYNSVVATFCHWTELEVLFYLFIEGCIQCPAYIALVEITRDQYVCSGSFDIDDDSWVHLKEIPTEGEFADASGDPVWDIFPITEAN